jgi:flagellar hook assembly protein FlgD
MKLSRILIVLLLVRVLPAFEFTEFIANYQSISPNADGVRDVLNISFTPSTAETIVVQLWDLGGQTRIAQLYSNTASSLTTVEWNGKNSEGAVVPDGYYQYTAQAAVNSGHSQIASWANKFVDENSYPVSVAVWNNKTTNSSDDIIFVVYPYNDAIYAYNYKFELISSSVCPAPLLNLYSTWYLTSLIDISTNGNLYVANYYKTNILVFSNAVFGTNFETNNWRVFWQGEANQYQERPSGVATDGDHVYWVQGNETSLNDYLDQYDKIMWSNMAATTGHSFTMATTTQFRDIMTLDVKGDTILLRSYSAPGTFRYRLGTIKTNGTHFNYDSAYYSHYYGTLYLSNTGPTNCLTNYILKTHSANYLRRYIVTNAVGGATNWNEDPSFQFGGFGSSGDRGYTFTGLAHNDLNGEFLVADLSYTVKRYDQTGTLLATLDLRGTNSVCRPISAVFNPVSGQYIVSDNNPYFSRIHFLNYNFISNSFSYNSTIGQPGNDLTSFNYPRCLAVDSEGYIYIADYNNARIMKYTSTGTFVSEIVSGYNPTDIEYFDGRLYITDANDDKAYVFSTSGTLLCAIGKYDSVDRNGNDGFQDPYGIAVRASDRHVFISDYQNHEIEEWLDDGSGQLTYITNYTNNLYLPCAIEAGPDGRIFFSANRNNFNDIYLLNTSDGPHSAFIEILSGTYYAQYWDFYIDNAGNFILPEYYTGGNGNRGVTLYSPDNGYRGGVVRVDSTFPEVRLTYPINGESYSGAIKVIASVNERDLYRWALEYSLPGDPDRWLSLTSGNTSTTNTIIHQLNLDNINSSSINLRLQAQDNSGNIRNHEIIIKKIAKTSFAGMNFLRAEDQVFTNNSFGLTLVKNANTIDKDGLAYLISVAESDLPAYDISQMVSLGLNFKLTTTEMRLTDTLSIRSFLPTGLSYALRSNIGFYYFSGSTSSWIKATYTPLTNTADSLYFEGQLPVADYFSWFLANPVHTNNLLEVQGAFPNPVDFSSGTEITFSLYTAGINQLIIQIFDKEGRLIRDVYNGEAGGGYIDEHHWDGKNNYGGRVPNGIYFYYITVQRGNKNETSRGQILVLY